MVAASGRSANGEIGLETVVAGYEMEISESSGVRYLHFSSAWIQGAMRIARPWALELEYTRQMMAPLLLYPEADWPRSVLLIGLGAASLTKFLHRHRPQARLTVVEIEPAVVAAARLHFKLPDEDARLKIVIGDGADFVATTKKRYDPIMVDGFDEDCRTGMLDTLPFYHNARAHLSDSSIFVTNLLSNRHDFHQSLTRLRETFDGRAFRLPTCDSGNVIALAATGEPLSVPLQELRENALALKRNTGLDLRSTVGLLATAKSCKGGKFSL